jgi:hypothetical protein
MPVGERVGLHDDPVAHDPLDRTATAVDERAETLDHGAPPPVHRYGRGPGPAFRADRVLLG